MATTEQLHGQWWVPDSNGPSRTVPGVLTLSDSTEPRLDLHGDLYDIHELGFRTVHGNSGGRAVSLFETYIDSEKGGFTNGQKYTDQTIKLSGLVIGDSHVNDADELAFTESVIELDYLTYWARGVKIAVSHPEKSNEPYIFTIPVSAPSRENTATSRSRFPRPAITHPAVNSPAVVCPFLHTFGQHFE